MKKGEIFKIKILDMNEEGQGVGRICKNPVLSGAQIDNGNLGLVTFVPDAVVGDIVRVEVTKAKKSYAVSKLVKIEKPSPLRTDKFSCPHLASGCGGCRYASLSYETQLELKRKHVKEKIGRIGGVKNPVVQEIIGMEEYDNAGAGTSEYRNKAQFHISARDVITRNGDIAEAAKDPAVGFFRAHSRDVIDCVECHLQAPPAMAAADALRRFMSEESITAWDPRRGKGLLRHMVVKTGFESGEVMVIIAINGDAVPEIRKLAAMLDDAVCRAGYSLESLVISIKKGKNIVAAGSDVIHDRIGNLKFEISPESFYQVNPVQTQRLYDKVREYCGFEEAFSSDTSVDTKGSNVCEKPTVLDLYCGVGSIGLYCADSAEFVVGIESVKSAVIDANRNAVINNIVNARYICGKAEELLPEYVKAAIVRSADKSNETERKGIDLQLARTVTCAQIAILDPPRAGCKEKLLQSIAEIGVERIIYVSCDPATLARDIKILTKLGYEFKEATPVDMFPHTSHVETVVLMSRKAT